MVPAAAASILARDQLLLVVATASVVFPEDERLVLGCPVRASIVALLLLEVLARGVRRFRLLLLLRRLALERLA